MNNRFKFRVWDKVSKRYFYLELKFGDNGYHPDFITDPVFEQCTGLSDKNGNLIYESDYIKDKWNNTTYLIKWVDAKFMCIDTEEMMPDTSPRQDWLDKCGFEIIGNIHEQARQKDK